MVLNPPGKNPSAARGMSNLLWVLLPLCCHLGFSWIGFSPTDEGWLQAIARRLLEGEMPHRDFISVRPVLSAMLQMPVVGLGGEYTFWWARLWGWLEAGAIAWLWSGMLTPGGSLPWTRHLAFAAALFLSVHNFPIMAWHTLDGLLLCSVAVVLAHRNTPTSWCAAFFCVGMAILCRQNFAFFAPFLLVGLPWRRWWRGVWVAVPGLAYLAWMAAGGAIEDFFHQILATRGALAKAALSQYLESSLFLGGLIGGVVVGRVLAMLRNRPTAVILASGLAAAITLTGSILMTWRGDGAIRFSFLLFGSGLALLFSYPTGSVERALRFKLVAAIGLAWVASISLGYGSPALMGGVLLLLVGRLLLCAAKAPESVAKGSRLVLLPLVVALGLAQAYARQNYPYMERPARDLQWDAGAVLSGAGALRTNALTYAVLEDLQNLVREQESVGRSYALISDYSAHWVRAQQRNLLPLEWPQQTELTADPLLQARFIQAMRDLPPGSVIIAQKYLAMAHPSGFVPIQRAQWFYPAQTWLATYGTKIGETPFFHLYAVPR